MNGIPTVALSVDQLSIRFGGVTAVESMTFDVREGETLSLIGPNGAGKTSAFNAITGYLPAAAGESLSRRAPQRLLAAASRRSASCALPETRRFAGQLCARCQYLTGLYDSRSIRSPSSGLPSVARRWRPKVFSARC
jgi:branched-chain amino acid transport system ATP-binding protein